MFLMKKDTPVMEFNLDNGVYHVLNEKLLPYQLRNVFKETNENSLTTEYAGKEKLYIHDLQKNYQTLVKYLACRVLNLSRENAKKILNAYHFSQNQDSETKARIAITCHAISMTDDYWLKTKEQNLTWDKIDPRKTSLNQIVAHIALTGSSLTLTGQPHTPELTGQGAYAKAWQREDDGVYLYKKGTRGGNESEIEISISNILDCFDIPHVKYEKASFENHQMCKCKNMTSDELSIVTAEEIYSYCNRNNIEFTEFALSLDAKNIYQMCIMDYLFSNADRHMQNWGFYMNNNTGELIGCHPIFDHNNGFDEDTMQNKTGGDSLVFPGKTKQDIAHTAIKKYPIKCINSVSRDMFLSDKMYESFMSRACELGIYKKHTPSFLQKIGLKEFIKYEPVKLYQISQTTQVNSNFPINEIRDADSNNTFNETTNRAIQKYKEINKQINKAQIHNCIQER